MSVSEIEKPFDATPVPDGSHPPKARDYPGRFREIVSDPLNLLIERVPLAGSVEGDLVWLHNGNRAPASGPAAYYGDFSQILIINRGVHEPLEEYLFQELVRQLPANPVMVELGAYWGHYSMWLKRVHPGARVFMVEPNAKCLRAGRANFALNGFDGEFIEGFVGLGQFEIDTFLAERGIEHLDVLHCDIQGFEGEMLQGAAEHLRRKAVDYLFISTHGQKLHNKVKAQLEALGYRVEVSSDFDETTSFDGLLFASSPDKAPVFSDFVPMGRGQICASRPAAMVKYLARILKLKAARGG